MNIRYRTEHTVGELHAFVDLEIAIWGLSARDAVPMNLLHALTSNGGVLIGAYDGDQPVGMALGFPARRNRRWLLWSHMTGVHPDYQRRGIGFALKQHQKSWALENGFSQMRWTFDPLRAGNAYFNLARLGAQADTYHIDYYGEMTDTINAGLPSDRVEATWNLNSDLPDPPDMSSLHALTETDCNAVALRADSDGAPIISQDLSPETKHQFVEIPTRFPHGELALKWRLALRTVLQPALKQGASLTAFWRVSSRCWYVLSAPAPWFLYVVECADGSLYTGITTDLARRIAQHNSGHGAIYTTARRPVRCLGSWRFSTRSHALRAEMAFKRQSRATKLACIKQKGPFQSGEFLDDC